MRSGWTLGCSGWPFQATSVAAIAPSQMLPSSLSDHQMSVQLAFAPNLGLGATVTQIDGPALGCARLQHGVT